MAPKTLRTIFPLLLVVSLHLSQPSFAQKPVIHVTSSVSGVKVEVKDGGNIVANAGLTPGKEVQLRVDSSNVVYYASSIYGRAFASVHAYDPARDKGRAAIYWKVDNWGWSISYDNRSFKQDEPWESE